MHVWRDSGCEWAACNGWSTGNFPFVNAEKYSVDFKTACQGESSEAFALAETIVCRRNEDGQPLASPYFFNGTRDLRMRRALQGNWAALLTQCRKADKDKKLALDRCDFCLCGD